MTSDTAALRLARAFNTTPEYWMNMQTGHDVALAAARVEIQKVRIRRNLRNCKLLRALGQSGLVRG